VDSTVPSAQYFLINANVLVRHKSCTTFSDFPELQQSKTRQNDLETVEDGSRRLLKNPHMSRCCQFSEDRKEPSAGRSRSATDKLGDIARAENWRNPKGVSSLGHLSASFLSHSPFRGLLRPSTDICPKELTRDVRGFFNSLLEHLL
jgi:hypothetical protein